MGNVLGIDPGLKGGWCIIDPEEMTLVTSGYWDLISEWKKLSAPPDQDRFPWACNRTYDLIDRITSHWKPVCAVVESEPKYLVFPGQFRNASFGEYLRLEGVTISLAMKIGVGQGESRDVLRVSKNMWAGYAKDDEIKNLVLDTCPPGSDKPGIHEVDSIAIAWFGAHRLGLLGDKLPPVLIPDHLRKRRSKKKKGEKG